MSKKRAIALVAAAAAIFPFVVASPGHATDATAPSTCRTLVAGPTPSVEVDTDNDGNPEVRVPSLSNARLCAYGDVVFYDQPGWWSEPCNPQGTCQRFFVHYGLEGYAEAFAQLCFALDGRTVCTRMTPIRVPVDVDGGTMCIGVDATGGKPCSGGTDYISFS